MTSKDLQKKTSVAFDDRTLKTFRKQAASAWLRPSSSPARSGYRWSIAYRDLQVRQA